MYYIDYYFPAEIVFWCFIFQRCHGTFINHLSFDSMAFFLFMRDVKYYRYGSDKNDNNRPEKPIYLLWFFLHWRNNYCFFGFPYTIIISKSIRKLHCNVCCMILAVLLFYPRFILCYGILYFFTVKH